MRDKDWKWFLIIKWQELIWQWHGSVITLCSRNRCPIPTPETPAVEQLAMQAGSFSMPCNWDPERAACLQLSGPCPSSYRTSTSVSSDPSQNQDEILKAWTP